MKEVVAWPDWTPKELTGLAKLWVWNRHSALDAVTWQITDQTGKSLQCSASVIQEEVGERVGGGTMEMPAVANK